MERHSRRTFLCATAVAAAVAQVPRSLAAPATTSPRQRWIGHLERTAGPVLHALSEGKLSARMPVECKPGQEASRRQCTYLEAAGRTLAGIAPWLESGSETEMRATYARQALAGIAYGSDPASPDYFHFGSTSQSLVDAAFLGLALLRAPHALTAQLPPEVKRNLLAGLIRTRAIRPPQSNWLLFSAMVEAAIHALGGEPERAPVELAFAKHATWYVGDGVYGDGAQFHADFYDSFVIHPFLLALLDSPLADGAPDVLREHEPGRAQRYAAIQERTIARDGTWPVLGRSISYRCGAFHLLADMALRQQLPPGVYPAQVRCALTAAMDMSLGAPGTYDPQGWLRIGLAGHQPGLGETYISTGSLYLCTNAFLPLGLPADAAFWRDADADWTARKVWRGDDFPADHALSESHS